MQLEYLDAPRRLTLYEVRAMLPPGIEVAIVALLHDWPVYAIRHPGFTDEQWRAGLAAARLDVLHQGGRPAPAATPRGHK